MGFPKAGTFIRKGGRALFAGSYLVGSVVLAGDISAQNAPLEVQGPSLYAARSEKCLEQSTADPGSDTLYLEVEGSDASLHSIIESVNPRLYATKANSGILPRTDVLLVRNVPVSLKEYYANELMSYPEVCRWEENEKLREMGGRPINPASKFFSGPGGFTPTTGLILKLAADITGSKEHRIWAENLLRDLKPNFLAKASDLPGAYVSVPSGLGKVFQELYLENPEVKRVDVVEGSS